MQPPKVDSPKSHYSLHILMARKKRLQSDFNLSEHQVTSLARVLLPAIREYLLSEQGKKDYVEWTENKQKQLNKTKKSQ